MKQEIQTLLTNLISDCLKSANPTELFNALNRLRVGAESAQIILNLKM
jgi:hypothetical protein